MINFRFSILDFGLRPPRRAFTLVELMVTIVIIGLLAAMFLGGMQRAQVSANIDSTKSTIAKLNATMMQQWESYKNRRVQVDPLLVLTAPTVQGTNARLFCYQLWQQRGSSATDSLAFGPLNSSGALPSPLPAGYPTNLQMSAVRLLAVRELQKYEMPSGYADFANMSGTPGSYAIATPVVLPAPPPLAYAYLQRLNAAATSDPNQILANEAAECLYLIMSTGAQDDTLLGDQIRPDTIGDVDADGMPEIQDAWRDPAVQYTTTTVMINGTPTLTANPRRTNKPISWVRWPAGYISDLQPDPTKPPMIGVGATAPPINKWAYEFSLWRHDIFDPLKLDVPSTAGTAANLPRGYPLYPLIFSAGPDGAYDIVGSSGYIDPYNATGGLMGGQEADTNKNGILESGDNITNHKLGTGTGIGT